MNYYVKSTLFKIAHVASMYFGLVFLIGIFTRIFMVVSAEYSGTLNYIMKCYICLIFNFVFDILLFISVTLLSIMNVPTLFIFVLSINCLYSNREIV